MDGPRSPAKDADGPRDWGLWGLVVAAVISRLVWVIWVHPPQDHVFSDMAHYVHRARLVAGFEVDAGTRMLVWQAWGTHALLAIPLALVGRGPAGLQFAGLCWAGFSAGTVIYGYLLAVRVLPRWGEGAHWPALALGVLLLAWVPLLSHTGFFLSEVPFACVLAALTHGIARLIQTGRGSLATSAWVALGFALRPQIAVFVALLALAWVFDRRRGPTWSRRVAWPAVVQLGVALALVLGVSMARMWTHAGHLGVAENGAMNLTAGRCHNIVTRSFSSEEHLANFLATGEPRPDRRISLPGFRALGRAGPDHPLALRPALGGEAIDLVGYIGDAEVHREIRRRCYAATGLAGQLHYSVTNVALLGVVARPWPESSDAAAPQMLPVAKKGRDLAAWLAPLGLVGMVVALIAWARAWSQTRAETSAQELERRAGLGVCALQLLSLVVVAALFFGTPRLRVPYDPYLLICALGLVLAGRRAVGGAGKNL